jgi:glycine dehydrogenase subunit 2
MHELLKALCEITGMAWGTLEPFAGAHGEFTGMKIFSAWFAHKGEGGRRKILVPDSAHGTNPASARLAGMEVVEIKSDNRGLVSAESIKPHLDDSLAGIMLTNPNTLGLFETEIQEIAGLVHEAGGLLYYDGANFNALLGKARPGDMGFDVVHLNLHKTFSTPHGGGGPGAGPVLVASSLVPFLPVPDVVRQGETFSLTYDRPLSLGRVSGFYGNIAVLIRAYAYILSMGSDGLKKAGETAVLNANYLKEKLKILLPAAYDSLCKHEFVLSAKNLKEKTGVSAMHIAKRLLDYGVHPPTVYFPLIVPEALMLEPTETETRETLDEFVDIIREICGEAGENGEMVRNAPWTTPVRRVDEVRASRNPVLRWYPKKEGSL